MIRTIFSALFIAIFMSSAPACRCENNAGDYYFNGITLAAQDKLEEAKAQFEKSEADNLAARLSRDGYKTKICDGNLCR